MYRGANWTGGAGIFGSGTVLFGSDGSAAVGHGVFGFGAGGSLTYMQCRLQYVCSK